MEYNGARTYSLEGLKAREAWLLKRAKIEQKQMLDEALKPYRERDEAAAMSDKTVQKVRSAMEVAKEWDGFTEHMPDILAHLKTLPRRGESHLQLLVKAYLGVVIPKYKADRQKMRTDILNELRKAPAATSVKQASRAGAPKNVAQAANPSAPRDLEDVIKASIKGIAR
jgi:proline dehydrogenase